MVDIKALVKNGVHFGHLTWRWCPRMKPYIWGEKNGVHLIDVSKTAYKLEQAAQFVESIAAAGRPVLWVGTKKAAQGPIAQNAGSVGNPYVTHRWIGGTITNFSQVKKSITKLMHLEDVLKKSQEGAYTKKEYGVIQKNVERLVKNVGSVRNLTWPVGALIVVDINREHVAIKEARAAGVPVVALVDTNADPSLVDYAIPANDDVPRAVNIVLEYLSQAVARGNQVAAQRPQDEISAADAGVDQMLAQVLAGEEEEAKRAPRSKGAPARKPAPGRSRAPRRPAQ